LHKNDVIATVSFVSPSRRGVSPREPQVLCSRSARPCVRPTRMSTSAGDMFWMMSNPTPLRDQAGPGKKSREFLAMWDAAKANQKLPSSGTEGWRADLLDRSADLLHVEGEKTPAVFAKICLACVCVYVAMYHCMCVCVCVCVCVSVWNNHVVSRELNRMLASTCITCHIPRPARCTPAGNWPRNQSIYHFLPCAFAC
jgi:hypothetical protein